jgi:Na+-transporting NADH:ubiquinone oxidoreductase subunit NqrC
MEVLGYSSSVALVLIFFVVLVVIAILFLLTQYYTLKAIQPQNRNMSPGEVWLQLIPLFNLVWQFIVVQRIAESISRELSSNTFSFEEKQPVQLYQQGSRPTYQIGMAMCVLNIFGFIPLLGSLARIAGLICWIIYWVQLSSYKSQIISKNYSVTPQSTL